MRRLTLTDAELAVASEAVRAALAAELLAPDSRDLALELLDRIDAKLPPASDQHPAGPMIRAAARRRREPAPAARPRGPPGPRRADQRADRRRAHLEARRNQRARAA